MHSESTNELRSEYKPMRPIPNLDDLHMLHAVVQHGSFRAAAAALGTSQPRVSRAIKRIEERVGHVLVRRNSRSVAPTPLGRQYADRVVRLLDGLQSVEADLFGAEAMEGQIALSAPPAFGQRLLVRPLAAFRERYPGIHLDLCLEARRVDVIDEGVDIAIRFGPLAPSYRRQRLLVRGHLHLYGAPRFAETVRDRGPETALRHAPCLVFHATHLRRRWPFFLGDQVQWLEVDPVITSDSIDALIAFATAGAGITMMPDFIVRDAVEQGSLVQLTEPHQGTAAEVFAVTTEQERPPRVRALVEFLAHELAATRQRRRQQ